MHIYTVSHSKLYFGLRYSTFCPEQLSSWLSAIRDSTQLDSALSWNCSIQLWLNSNSRQRGVSHHKLQILFSFLSFLFTAYVGLQFIILHSTVYLTQDLICSLIIYSWSFRNFNKGNLENNLFFPTYHAHFYAKLYLDI